MVQFETRHGLFNKFNTVAAMVNEHDRVIFHIVGFSSKKKHSEWIRATRCRVLGLVGIV